MARKPKAKKSDNPAENVLQAMLDALIESKTRDQFLTADEFYALTCAFREAKPDLSKAGRYDFAAKVLKLLDWNVIRNDDEADVEYVETYESLIDALTT